MQRLILGILSTAAILLAADVDAGIVVPKGAPQQWKDRAKQAGVASKWRYDEAFDAMRNKTTYFSCLSSDNMLDFRFPYGGGVHGEVCFRNSPKFGKDVYLTMEKGQFDCSFEGCTVHMKFDNGKILSFGASESSGGVTNTIFIHGYGRLEQLMRTSKVFVLEATFYQEGAQQLTFSPAGFDWKH